MANTLEIQIQTLTPLWTGGIDGTCDRLHISGLMGSLRYWYEAIVRGAGGYACDPSDGGGCVYDPKLKEKSICAACYLFGTTGWARLFRLSLIGDPPKSDREKGIWAGQSFRLRLLFRPLSSEMLVSAGYAKKQIKVLLWLIYKYGGLGAKTQKNFGHVEVQLINDDWINFSLAMREVRSYKGPDKPNDLQWPDIRQFFSYEFDGSRNPLPVPVPYKRSKKGKIKEEKPMKNSALRTWLEEKYSQRVFVGNEDPFDIILGRETTDDNKKRTSRLSFIHPVDKSKHSLRLFGFGVDGLFVGEQPLNGSGLQQIVESYTLERWADAHIVQQWDANLLEEGIHA